MNNHAFHNSCVLSMTKKPKLLVLTPRYPYPTIGGDRLRIIRVCEILSKYFSLTLLSLCETQKEMDMPLPADGIFTKIERVLLVPSRSRWNALIALFSKTPLQVAYYQSPIFARRIKELLPEHDGVLSHLIRCGEYVRYSDKPKILEMTDAISLNYSRLSKISNLQGLRALIYRIESLRLLPYEKALVEDFDLSVLVSEIDKSHLVVNEDEKFNDKVIVCSNGVELKNLSFQFNDNPKRVVAFIGNMNSYQNLDACLYFAREVLPLLNETSHFIFRIVGKINQRDVNKLKAFENVEITGAVDNIDEATRGASIGVCPVRIAAGVQNKVLEYMGLGLPVVTSTIGLEGLNAHADTDLLVADTPQEYVEQIIKLHNDNKLRKMLAVNARNYVEENHKWDKQLAPMITRIARLFDR